VVSGVRRRQAALLSAAALVCSMIVVGCGSSSASSGTKLEHLPAAQHARLIAELNATLAIDQRAVYAYVVANGRLEQRPQRTTSQFLGQELTHAGVLRSLVTLAGGVPHARSYYYAVGDPHGASAIQAMLLEIERQQIASYASALEAAPLGWVRAELTSILANTAQHVTELRFNDNLFPTVPSPFVLPLPSRIQVSHPRQLKRLEYLELVAIAAYRSALHSGDLHPGGSALLRLLLAQEEAHAQLLAKLLGEAEPAAPTGPAVEQDLINLGVTRQLVNLHRQVGWFYMLIPLEFHLEGILYYDILPRLSQPEALVAASIMANEAQHSTVLQQLENGYISVDVPTAMVRGQRPPDAPDT
jgi:hypothetical protein